MCQPAGKVKLLPFSNLVLLEVVWHQTARWQESSEHVCLLVCFTLQIVLATAVDKGKRGTSLLAVRLMCLVLM
jgi:hypothetical protein